jgi:hypothetical protein
MQTIDSGFCRTPSGAGQAGATQGSGRFRGSLQDRADQFVRATVLSDLGQSVGHGRHARGIQGVADAVSKALSGQDVTGTDAADDVLKKIETSLHKAAQAMADRGVDGKTIDATIDRFRAQLAGALDGMVKGAPGSGGTGSTGSSSGSNAGSSSSGSSGASGSSSASSSSGTAGSGGTTGTSGSSSTAGSSGAASGSATNAPAPADSVTSVSKFVGREVRKERGAIDLVTAEGDRVSIRFRSKEVVTGSVTEATSSDGTTTTAAKSSLLSRGGMKIEVDGDLNEDELKAIGDLLGKVDDIATKFFSGDVQAAFSAAGSVGADSDQIAAYRMNLTYSRKVTAAYGAWGTSPPASTQPPATTGNGAGSAGSVSGSTSGGSASSVSGSASSSGSTGSGGSASTAGSASSVDGSATASTDGTSGSATSTSDSASGTDASAGAAGSTAGSGATDSTTTTGSSDTPPATTPPASAQKTIINFINDALSKLGSANGVGRLSFSTHWKLSVLVTAIQSTQPAQPATPSDQSAAANTQLLGDSLQKIASV